MEKQNTVSAHIDIDTTEAKANIEELTLAINECVNAFEKLVKVMNKYTGEAETVELYCDGEVIAQTIVQSND
ncbi:MULTISPECIES: hypothetical protein [Bacillus cereus group]|uniref:Uncharacterized protein n=1 Tax=Bacillus thuringiensis TaxID=1428 RepID=A0A1C4FYQ2_BACTU|nr:MULTISPECIES: hypothetical protein [Bacillus cereus group]MED3022341.1 hypothetical protein [Bacillus wiedmannii]OTX94440.1 hypothetical protein BK729_29705 [Bacillus thuringiensis serovar wratislaviensis]OUB56203.1 hypothetical protein BK743_21105 [Bacillus thuringiensis serovar sylvestriensis]SCC60641.1 Uncharacterized protein BTT61001_04918 [Bacillus thuringiensis]